MVDPGLGACCNVDVGLSSSKSSSRSRRSLCRFGGGGDCVVESRLGASCEVGVRAIPSRSSSFRRRSLCRFGGG